MDEKYNTALEEARKLYNDSASNPGRKEWLAKIFPELAEIEDEDKRKRVIEHLKLSLKGAEDQNDAGCDRTRDIGAFKWGIAYLEKQKEQTKEYPHSVIENAISFLTERNDGMPKDEARNIVNAVISVIKPEHWPRYRIQQPAEWTGYSGIVIDKTKYPELTDAEFAILRGFARVTGCSHFPITIVKETAQDFLAHLVMISEINMQRK